MSELEVLALAVALLLVVAYFLGPRGPRISGAEARRLVKEGAQLVDVRTSGEFASGHIEGALNIPVQDLEARSSELARGRALVVYCRSGQRSGMAARRLKRAGFDQVHDLGAMSRW
jgi:phage shock protein E